MERKIQSIVAGVVLATFRPFPIESFWPRAVLFAGLLVTWPAVGVVLVRFREWYAWNSLDTTQLLIENEMRGVYRLSRPSASGSYGRLRLP